MILISACLLGVNCKYSGGNNKNLNLIHILQDKKILPVCPEVLGGLLIPRKPAEITNGTSLDVLHGRACICLKDGTDVTRYYLKGAEETKKIALSPTPVNLAILKERSPSCGVDKVYDGTFSGKIIPGSGICTTLLKEMGIPVISEETTLTGKTLDLIRRS